MYGYQLLAQLVSKNLAVAGWLKLIPPTSTSMKNIVPNLLAAAALAFCGTALAQKAGTFSASIGFTTIAPSVNGGDLTVAELAEHQS